MPDALIAQLTAQRLLFPCFFGSALRLDGIDALLNALCSLLPAPQWPQDFSARIYKISRDPQGARLTWLKITGGSLKAGTWRDLTPEEVSALKGETPKPAKGLRPGR